MPIGRPFEKGHPGLKPKGPHETTKEVKDAIRLICEKRLPKVFARMDEMDLKTEAQFLTALLPYVLSKEKTTIEHSRGLTIPKEIEALSLEQVYAIEEIMKGKAVTYQIENGK